MFAVCGNDIQSTLTKLTAEIVLLNDFVSDISASKSDLLQEVSHGKHVKNIIKPFSNLSWILRILACPFLANLTTKCSK